MRQVRAAHPELEEVMEVAIAMLSSLDTTRNAARLDLCEVT